MIRRRNTLYILRKKINNIIEIFTLIIRKRTIILIIINY